MGPVTSMFSAALLQARRTTGGGHGDTVEVQCQCITTTCCRHVVVGDIPTGGGHGDRLEEV